MWPQNSYTCVGHIKCGFKKNTPVHKAATLISLHLMEAALIVAKKRPHHF